MKGLSKPWPRVMGFLCALLIFLSAASAPASQDLRVTSLLPRGETQRITQVVVGFDRDMRPLGDMSQDEASSPLIISPRPAGSYRWLDTRTLAYILDRPLVGAGRLHIKVAKGAKALDGATLPKDVTATAHTPEVSVVELHPKTGRILGPRPQMFITINQPVDLESLADCAVFWAGKERIKVKAVELARPGWQREHLARVYGLTPIEDLPKDRQAVLEISPGLRPSRGDLSSSRTFRFTYHTYRDLKLAKWRMDQGHGGKDPRAALILEFSNPVSPKKIFERLNLKPAAKLDPERQGDEPSNHFYLEADFKPRTNYELILRPGLIDSYNTTMTEGVRIRFATGDLPPVFLAFGRQGNFGGQNQGVVSLEASQHRQDQGLL